MNDYTYQNTLISKKQLKKLLSWSFTKYDSMQACALADELKHLGFKYASQAGISISIEDLKVPFSKNLLLQTAYQEIRNAEKIFLKGKITDVERFQKIIDTWNLTSEALKDEVVSFFKNYDPLNSVYIMAFSGARGNLSQVRQLVGLRGLMSDPSGEILKLPIKKNFREGLTITDYLISGYGARKGIIDTALKTANSGYLTRRLIDVAQDIIIREKDCLTTHSCLAFNLESKTQATKLVYEKILGRLLNKPIYDLETHELIAEVNTQVTPNLIRTLRQKNITNIYIRSPLTCSLYRSICQKCYGWDLANENLVDIGEAIGIIAGQSIGEPGTQLTMRTFHTGGIFTSEIREKIKSPINGIIKFSKRLKQIPVRTNRGEDVLLTKNSGSLLIIPEQKDTKPIKLELFRNTILFRKNNQYIKKDGILAELVDEEKETRTEVRPILTNTAGEVFIPRLTNKLNSLNKTKLLWVLSGQVYQAPKNSFLNFYSDYKINKNSYIYRTKLSNHSPGYVKYLNDKSNLFSRILQVVYKSSCYLADATIQKLSAPINKKNYILNFRNLKYLINLKSQNSKLFVQISTNKHFGTSLTKNFLTLTGGTIYYDYRLKQRTILQDNSILYFKPYAPWANLESVSDYKLTAISRVKPLIDNLYHLFLKDLCWDLESGISEQDQLEFDHQKVLSSFFCEYQKLFFNDLLFSPFSIKKQLIYPSLIWLGEETYNLNCDRTILLAEHGNFISKNFEIAPGTFSKTSGIVTISEKNNIAQEVSIKSGLVYKGKQFKNFESKVFYPGEILLDTIKINQPSLCEYMVGKLSDQLLIRPLEIYEIPRSKPINKIFGNESQIESVFDLKDSVQFSYKSNQTIKSAKNINLVTNVLDLALSNSAQNHRKIELAIDKSQNCLNFLINKNLRLNDYIPARLRYTNIQSCLLIGPNQFIDSYTTLGYLEAVTPHSLEIVKFKSKHQDHKQVCLISNEDCLTIEKEKIQNKTIDDLLINNIDVNQTGKIIIENDRFLTIQKGRPYFFPNCKNDDSIINTDLRYKLIPSNYSLSSSNLKTNRSISLNYYDVTKGLLTQRFQFQNAIYKFSKIFIKKNGKLYSSVLPGVLKRFVLTKKKSNSTVFPELSFSSLARIKVLVDQLKKDGRITPNADESINKGRLLFMKNSELIVNPLKPQIDLNPNLTIVQLITSKFYRVVGIHSITDDYFEQEVNSLFCKDGEFVENGQTIGLLNFEKEITEDIVQGLPRVEQLLEARKKKQTNKNLSINQKKSLLTQTTSIDSYFEFRKLGTTIKENQKINPHSLLKVYFSYYGSIKHFFCDKDYVTDSYRLANNYEASYRSFKKVQSLILNSVQSVYKSQGVSIADKHLEVIIKQMTTKVLITHQGSTSLLPREVIDLYHIKYINEIVKTFRKSPALYVPLLLGITKAALNNPSFVSAASFQETTRVLTKAAIEGRVDWLRGLKENIIIGHLIPAGTGSQNYKNCFNKNLMNNTKVKLKVEHFKRN